MRLPKSQLDSLFSSSRFEVVCTGQGLASLQHLVPVSSETPISDDDLQVLLPRHGLNNLAHLWLACYIIAKIKFKSMAYLPFEPVTLEVESK